MYKLNLTEKDYNTIMTAPRIELERNWGGDAHVVKLLESAVGAVRSAEKVK